MPTPKAYMTFWFSRAYKANTNNKNIAKGAVCEDMIKNDNSFICINCGRQVDKLNYTSRNHCPFCLHSLHVDVVPGDRANTCKGTLKPVAIENSAKKGYIIVHKCLRCGEIKRNKSADDDNFDEILKIAKISAENNRYN